MIKIAYDGTNYNGWQTGTDKIGIESVLNKKISKLTGEDIKIIGTSRTDSGVHSNGNIAVFDTESNINPDKFFYALNNELPDDISILSSKEVDKNFHARFSAKKKEYVYKIYTGKELPFYARTHYLVKDKVDLKLLKEASKVFIGKHNFQNLTSKERDDKDFVRTIYSIKINKKKDEILISLTGNAFMRYMVRDIVAEMILVATKKQQLSDLRRLFSKPRHITNHKAPAEGLYLNKVFYE